MKVRAKFIFEVIERSEGKFIKIIDLNQGDMSVTNDIENVVAYIARAEELDPTDYIIIYRDTASVWSGWYHKTERYVLLHTRDFECAITNYLSIRQASQKKPQSIFSL